MPGQGPAMVITDLGCFEFEEGEMVLTSLHPGRTLEEIRENIGWDVRIAPELKTTAEPTAEELRTVREELDPAHLYV